MQRALFIAIFLSLTCGDAHAIDLRKIRKAARLARCAGEALKEKLTDRLAPDPLAALEELRTRFPELDQYYAQEVIEEGANLLHEARRNPGTAANAILHEGKTAVEGSTAILDFVALTRSAANGGALDLDKFSRWASTEARADFLYDHLDSFGTSASAEILTSLRSSNPLFQNTIPLADSPGALLTFSFEKESYSEALTEYFRPSSYSDDQWFALDKKTRLAELHRFTTLTDPRALLERVKRPLESLTRTSKCPPRISPLMQEPFMFDNEGKPVFTGLPYEVKHADYEIEMKNMFRQAREIASKTGETDAFHFNAVTEIPENYPHVEALGRWLKEANDYLYLRGIEEKLHPSSRTALPSLASLPRTAEDLKDLKSGSKRFKLVTLAVRGGIYGPARKPGYFKLAFELRDATRDLDRAEATLGKLADSVATRTWEKGPPPPESFLINVEDRKLVAEVEAYLKTQGLTEKESADVMKATPSITLPLHRFEDRVLFNYRTGQPGKPLSVPAKAAFETARREYFKSLDSLARELIGFREKGEKVELVDIAYAIKLNLTEWAAKAKPSELFSGI